MKIRKIALLTATILQIIVVLFFTIVAISNSLVSNVQIKKRIDITDLKYSVAGEITKSNPISFSFNLENSNLIAIRLEFATFVRRNNCHVAIQLHQDNILLINKIENCAKIVDNHFIEYEIKDAGSIKSNSNFKLQISSPDGHPGDAVGVYKTQNDVFPSGLLKIGGKDTSGDLNLQFLFGDRN